MTRQEILRRLQQWHDEAERIVALFDVRGERVQAQDQEKAKLLLNKLRDELEAEHNRLRSRKSLEGPSPGEAALYETAVHEGFAALRHIQKNFTPDAKCFTALDALLICMERYLR